MNNYTHIKILALQSVFLVVLLMPVVAFAADSTSFRLYDGVSDIVDQSPLGSTSFSLNEGGETWVAYPISGSNFQIVTAPPVSSSSSSASSVSSSVSSETEIDRQGAGGGRGSNARSVREGVLRPSAPDKEPTRPRLPAQIIDQPDEAVDEQPSIEVPLPDVEYVPDDQLFAVPTDAVTDDRAERRIVPPHFFDLTEEDQLVCVCPEVHAAPPQIIRVPVPVPMVFQNPVPSMLMLMSAFGLGYLSKLFRPGHVQVASAPRPKKKKR
ncbi:MAG: hypothetical protein QF793_01150 [Candidatus Peribacteraceae bacterium]|jgi:hypothetical protein|nr:hypothetical protein [bacterium]MDP6561510.1 hypothetical protein [Candidatus Peribacteraceae bacterium]|tara:strand:- start:6603 stop:7403 length:801 start_codon:yes stop_codon:yes gene_type:complete